MQFRSDKLADMSEVPLRLHIGGEEPKAGWTILNVQEGPHVDALGDCRDLSARELEEIELAVPLCVLLDSDLVAHPPVKLDLLAVAADRVGSSLNDLRTKHPPSLKKTEKYGFLAPVAVYF